MRGLGLAAALVAILALVLIEFVYRNRFRRATYHWMLFLGLFVLPGIALMSMATMVSEETKKVDACATCHVMDPFINDMRDPFSATLAARHYKNKWVPDHQCYMCHTTYGAHGTLAAKRDGFRHWLLYVTATWEEPIQYSGSYPNSNCLTCHEGTSKFDRGKSHPGTGQRSGPRPSQLLYLPWAAAPCPRRTPLHREVPMNTSEEATVINKLVRIAVGCALIGLLSVLLFLWSGFAPWSVGIGVFFGAPLLVIAVMLYLIAVVRDLRQRGVL